MLKGLTKEFLKGGGLTNRLMHMEMLWGLLAGGIFHIWIILLIYFLFFSFVAYESVVSATVLVIFAFQNVIFFANANKLEVIEPINSRKSA